MAAGRCKAAYNTDEYHGYGCSITGGACMFLYPDSKACAEKYGEGPDAEGKLETDAPQESPRAIRVPGYRFDKA